MKIRNPTTTANIWSSGKITCTGAKRFGLYLLIIIFLSLIESIKQRLFQRRRCIQGSKTILPTFAKAGLQSEIM